MRTWKRAGGRLQCGAENGCVIATGSPYLELKIGEMHRALLRCERHAGEAPKDIHEPTIARVERPPSTAKPLRWLATQAEQRAKRMQPRAPIDARARAARNDA